MYYKPVIGLEIHAELNTKTKMFCDSANDSLETRPNVNVCPVCLAHPGTLPVINIEAVHKVVKVGLALSSKINELSWFERKNYFYPDLPKGYQVSQYEKPFCEGGVLRLPSGKEVRIRRVHLEEDTGRLIHESQISNLKSQKEKPSSKSLIDFNRAGVPLMELVTEPDIESGAEAKEFGEEFQLLLRYLAVSDADMEKGQLRIEANISLKSQIPEAEQARYGAGSSLKSQKLGTKVEIKNLNSFRAAERAIGFEIERQCKLLEEGKEVVQETRGWDETEGWSFSQRQKEESHDYRYFPEPDLPPVRLEKIQIDYIKSELPELPASRRERFVKEYNIAQKDSQILTVQKELGDYFEKVASELKDWLATQMDADTDADQRGKNVSVSQRLPRSDAEYLLRGLDPRQSALKLASNYLITELQKLLFEAGQTFSSLKITPEDFAELIVLIHQGKISSSAAQTILAEMFKTGEDPDQILQDKNLTQIGDVSELKKAAEEVIVQNPKAVEDYKKGKPESLKFLVGQLMRATRGRANPQVGEEILRGLLE